MVRKATIYNAFVLSFQRYREDNKEKKSNTTDPGNPEKIFLQMIHSTYIVVMVASTPRACTVLSPSLFTNKDAKMAA